MNSAAPHAIDNVNASVRLPVLIFFGCAAAWLVVGTFLCVIAGIKLAWPQFLDSTGFLTYGRIAPAALNALVYGWASSAGFGIALWLLARIGRVPLSCAVLPVVSAIFWNVGVFLGICAILSGYGRAVFLLEFPGFISPILFAAYLFIAMWGIVLFRSRRPDAVYVSSWYLVAALLWFPWLYFTGNALLVWSPVAGSAQTPIASWFASGVMSLWLAPIALASAFYLIPQILGRRIVSDNLTLPSFWLFAFFAPWTGTAQLIGGPLPAWMVSAGVAASLLLLIPVLLTSINLLGTMRGSFDALRRSPALCFATVGAGAFLLVYAAGAVLAIPKVSAVFHFSDVVIAQGALFLLGFVSMSFFGAIYYIVPRLTGREWRRKWLTHWHFWLFLGALGVGCVSLTVGGRFQGFVLAGLDVPFEFSVGYATPFRIVAVVCAIALLAGAKCFAWLLFSAILQVLEDPQTSSRTVAP